MKDNTRVRQISMRSRCQSITTYVSTVSVVPAFSAARSLIISAVLDDPLALSYLGQSVTRSRDPVDLHSHNRTLQSVNYQVYNE